MRPEEWIGRTLARTYLMESLLGSGGMGAVYCARHLRTRGLVAVKILRPEFATEHEILRRFYLEAQLIAKLRHPHIVQVTDCYEADGSDELPVPFLVMELLHGEDLHTRLRRVGTLSYAETHKLATEVGGALQAVHNHNIIHRDIKPMNLFLHRHDSVSSEDEVYKVVDFGVSKTQDGSQPTTGLTFLGTPQYASPESAGTGGVTLDARSDQFSLSVVLYRVLSGRLPFDGEDELGVLYQVRYEEPVPLRRLVPSLPGHALAAIERAMRKDREARFSSILEFVQAYMGRPLSAQGRPPAWVASPSQPSPRTAPPTREPVALLPAAARPMAALPAGSSPVALLPAAEVESETLPFRPSAHRTHGTRQTPPSIEVGPPAVASSTPEVSGEAWSIRQLVWIGLASFALVAAVGAGLSLELWPAPSRRPTARPAQVMLSPSAAPAAQAEPAMIQPQAPVVAPPPPGPEATHPLVPSSEHPLASSLKGQPEPEPVRTGPRHTGRVACPTPPKGRLHPADAVAEHRLQAFLRQGSLCLGRDHALVFRRNPFRAYQFRLQGHVATGVKYAQVDQLQSWLNERGHVPDHVETVTISP